MIPNFSKKPVPKSEHHPLYPEKAGFESGVLELSFLAGVDLGTAKYQFWAHSGGPMQGEAFGMHKKNPARLKITRKSRFEAGLMKQKKPF